MEIPEIQMDENKIVLPTMTTKIKVNGVEKDIVFQKVSAGRRRILTNKHLKTSIVGSQMQGNVDMMGFQMEILKEAIKEAPFPITDEAIASLPDNVLDYLFKLYSNWADSGTKKD